MPLKHFTETVLIVVLGAVTILTGVLIATLPLLPQGMMPALVLLALTLIYAFSLHPLLKKNRADNEFRLMHLAPAALVILWIIIQTVSFKYHPLLVLHRLFTWGWTFLGVLFIFGFLIWFCLHVIRRRVPRLTFLGILLGLFAVFAVTSEMNGDLPEALSASLWQHAWSKIALSKPPEIAMNDSSAGSSSSASSSSVAVVVKKRIRRRLPKSGPEFDGLALLMGAMYCGTLHKRARRRA